MAKVKLKKKGEKNNDTAQSSTMDLQNLINQNNGTDFYTINLLSNRLVDSLNWTGFEKNKPEMIKKLKAYQRLLRVLPKNDPQLIQALMSAGIQSSIQIASIPKKKFISAYLPLFNNDIQVLEQTYNKALLIRAHVLLKHISAVQNAEPHAKGNGKLILI